jgi:hypothetical protein
LIDLEFLISRTEVPKLTAGKTESPTVSNNPYILHLAPSPATRHVPSYLNARLIHANISIRRAGDYRLLSSVKQSDFKMTSANPYISPNISSLDCKSETPEAPIVYKMAVAWAFAYFYPAIATLLLYASWIFAWLCLGHMPRPMLDDPKDIGWMMDLAYLISMIAFVSVPLLTPVCFFASFFCPFRLTKYRILEYCFLTFTYIAICTAIFTTVRADPCQVVEWWFD